MVQNPGAVRTRRCEAPTEAARSTPTRGHMANPRDHANACQAARCTVQSELPPACPPFPDTSLDRPRLVSIVYTRRARPPPEADGRGDAAGRPKGNIRNSSTRSSARAPWRPSHLDLDDLPDAIRAAAPDDCRTVRPLVDRERAYIRAVVDRHHGRRRWAAKELGLSVSTLNRRLRGRSSQI